MFKIIVALSVLLLPLPAYCDGDKMKNNTVLKISVLSSNKVLLNGVEIGLNDLEREFASAKSNSGVVWYYRENPENEPPPVGSKIIKMVIDNRLPISLSTKPDFSDTVDENGVSKPR